MMRWMASTPDRLGGTSDDEGEECVPWEHQCEPIRPPMVGLCSFCVDHAGGELVEDDEIDLLRQTLTGAEIQQAVASARSRPSPAPVVAAGIYSSPDLSPEGWISRKGPNGRLYWHHRSLGRAPWEEEPASARCEVPLRGSTLPALPVHVGMPARGTVQCYMPPVRSHLPDECWMSHIGPGGRTFWHNRSLGPAPWEIPREIMHWPQTTI